MATETPTEAKFFHANIPQEYQAPEEKKLGISMFIIGGIGTRKTSFAAQWPAPVFLSIQSEGGDRSLNTYPKVAAHLMSRTKYPQTPPVANEQCPQYFPIRFHGSHRDPYNKVRPGGPYKWYECLEDAVTQIEKNYKEWGIGTVVVDSGSYLCRLWISDLLEYRYYQVEKGSNNQTATRTVAQADRLGGDILGPPEYGMLAQYLSRIQTSLSKLPINLIWIVNKEEIWEPAAKAVGGATIGEMRLRGERPGLVGRVSKVYIPGATDLIVDATVNLERDVSVTSMDSSRQRQKRTPTFWTVPSDVMPDVRHRFFDAFEKGYIEDKELKEPTFRAVWSEEAIRPWIAYGKYA